MPDSNKQCDVCDTSEDLVLVELKDGKAILCCRDSLIDEQINPERTLKGVLDFRNCYVKYYMIRNAF
jgi:hypothetical protein